MTGLPALDVVVKRVAHDVRGPVGVIVAALHEIEETIAGLADADVMADLKRLLEMARRGTRKLERTAFSLDAIGALQAPAVSHVDLQPMVKTAIERMQAAERRPQVTVTWVDAPETTLRVIVAPTLFTHALEEIFGYAIRKSARAVRVTTKSSTQSNSPAFPMPKLSSVPRLSESPKSSVEIVKSPHVTSLVITMVGVDFVPASTTPFEEPLGLAAHLLSAQHASLAIHKRADGVDFIVGVLAP